MASSNFRRELDSFRAVPKESLSRLGTRFDEVADPLIENDQMTARHLAMHFVTRLPVGDSATYLYINEVLISSAKVAVIVRGSLTLLVLVCFSLLVIRVYDLK